jgi:hypothetical protein
MHLNGQDLGRLLEAIKIISPRLHHLPALFKMCGPVVCATVGVLDRMSKLMLDEIRAETEYLIK